MNRREKVLAAVVALLVGLVGIKWLVWDEILVPYEAKQAQIDSLAEKVDEKRNEVEGTIQKARVDLARWGKGALPADKGLAQTLYQDYLNRQLSEARIDRSTITVSPPIRRSGYYTRLPFGIQTHCSLEELTRFLHGFYASGYFHHIHRLTLKPGIGKDREGDSNVQIDIEAFSMADAMATVDTVTKEGLPTTERTESEQQLASLSLANFSLFEEKNLFEPTRLVKKPPPLVRKTGPPSPPPLRDERSDFYVRAAIVVDGVGKLWLENVKTKRKLVILEGQDLVIEGLEAKVVVVSPRQVILEVSGERGEVRLGKNLASWKRLADSP